MKMFAGKLKCIGLLIAAILAFSAHSFAQSARGELAGTVLDTTGAVIPNAQIVAVNAATGATSQTVSTSSGAYRFPGLSIGSYTVTATAPGFEKSSNTGLQVTINSVSSLNLTLKTGAVTETVNVDASGLRVETESSEISGTVSGRQIEDLPLSLAQGVGGLRSPETFVFLLPGTTGPGTGGNNSANGVFFSRLSGGQAYGAEVLLDGASIQRSENGSSFDETSPSIEALQEFKVTTSTPSAEYGRTTSGIESFSVKSGTNNFHGLAYAIVKNRVFDANNWFNNGYKAINCVGVSELDCQYSLPQDQKYDFGGVFSGPVHIPHVYNGKDKTFFLFAWEKYQLHFGGVAQSTVPTAAQRTGDFSAVLGGPTGVINPCTGMQVLQNQIFDPSTTNDAITATNPTGTPCRLPFPGNVIPSSDFSAAAQKLIAGLPLPNQTGNSTTYGFQNNYVYGASEPIINTTYTIRIDQNISDKDKIFGTYDSRENFKTAGGNGIPNFPEPFNSANYIQDFVTHYGRAGWDYSLTPTLVNQLNLGYNRTNSSNVSSAFGDGRSLTDVGVANEHSTAFPILYFDGLDSFSTLGQQQNGINIDNGARINDSVSWQKGRHSIKVGVDIRYQQYSTEQLNVNSLTFHRGETAFAACCNQYFPSGNSIASLLLGAVDSGDQTVYNDNPRWNSHYIAGFVEDDIKVSNNLTVNLGLRYDVDSPRHEAEKRTSNFSLTAPDAKADGLPGAIVFGVNCHCNSAWADTWYKDFAPRVGFAYTLPNTNGKAVLRGGGAIIYGPLQYSDFGSSMTAGYTQYRNVFSQFSGPGTGGAFTPAFQLDSGFPANVSFAPSLDPDQLDLGPGTFGAVGGDLILPNNGRPSMTDDWSLQLQDELAQDLLFTIGYIGQSAQSLRSGYLSNINNLTPASFHYGDLLSDPSGYISQGGSNHGVTAPYSTFAGNLGQAIRPFPQYDYIAGDCCLENKGHSTYDAMVVSLERRFRNGFNLQASYTWSKELTDSDSILRFSYESAEPQGQASANLHQEKAVSVQNTPQQLSLSYLYEFPIGKGRKFLNNNRLVDTVIGGWQVGAIQRYQTGQPIPFGCASGIPYYQNCISFSRGPAAQGSGFASAAYKKNKNGPSVFNGQSWFKPAYRPAGLNGPTDPGVPLSEAAFVDVNREGTGWFRQPSPSCPDGCSYDPFSLGTGIPHVTEEITGPAYLAEDISLLKNFHMTEKIAFQVKGEAFDIFNRHRMGLPDLEPNDSTGNLGFGIPGGTDYGPRQMQVSGRFTF